MRYTVLGATGFIGRHLSVWLRTQGHEVHTPLRGDMLDPRVNMGRIIYAIGLTANFRERPLDTVDAHVNLLADVLRRAKFESLVYLSSTRVYAGVESGSEDAHLSVRSQDPSDLYNLSKLMGESLCLHAGRANTRVARISNVLGPGKADSADFVPALVREARAGHIRLRSNPASAKDYLAISDLLPMLVRLAEPGCRYAIYNLASGVQISHSQWINRLVERTGCLVTLAPEAPIHNFPQVAVERIKTEFGFQASDALTTLDQLLE
jgi:nucleoside-diphosphate-sugar epimerase